MRKKILLTGGGTAGHVTPNLALLNLLRKNSFEIHYAGTKKGIEHTLVKRAGIPYHSIKAGKLRRYFDLKNFTDIFNVALGLLQSILLMIRLRPNVVFSKGGFVSCPVVWAAWLFRVPAVIHESDISPGLANKLSARFAKKICFSFPETARYIPSSKGVQTGLPVRENLLSGSARQGKEICGFGEDKPVLLIIGGSQGSQFINSTIRSSLDILLKDFFICHICGKGALIENPPKGYCQFEYVNEELSHIFAMADVVISRSGATTLFELLELKKPNLLVPLSTGASRGDQILNAQSFQNQGYSTVLLQENLTSESLISGVKELFKNRETYINAMEQSGTADSRQLVTEQILSIVK
ncbi:UDP-N-acetylglucosamine--N-acetylmuramyl- (pentapeptide) pyrophosphoryl-undecaprenol N-acetylglucosamine transferase [Chitinispirillum alkaliphilum]|nr:UDP-N-acetylglucosamine--N-acetylmuramyl- (pentapeptide) pyrophosphoryl-undecaprenol N-acetylglucosamine transferase [Chitinispirillum alkaliphilum]